MIEGINWEKLYPYNGDMKKSFEELCFQICFEEFSEIGVFTRIDDSGGGDGVEFYLTLPNGEILGWQCKFFARLSEGGRKKQIKKSLKKAYSIHGDKLKKWYLCSQKSFTPIEKKWFDGELYKCINNSSSFELIHWGDSELINLLRKHPDIHRYFFSEKILDINWFNKKFQAVLNTSNINSKYNPDLHISNSKEEIISYVLKSKKAASFLKNRMDWLGIENFKDDFENALNSIEKNENQFDFSFDYQKIKSFLFSNNYKSIIKQGNELLVKSCEIIITQSHVEELAHIQRVEEFRNKFEEFYLNLSSLREFENIPNIHWDTEEKEKDPKLRINIRKCRETILDPFFTIRSYIEAYLNLFNVWSYTNINDLFITGKASKGKTHLSLDLVNQHLIQNKPAIYISGLIFKSNISFKEQIRHYLDFPSYWSFSDFLEALNISGRVSNTKALFIIDGLNEALNWKILWKSELEILINEISEKYKNILLITTCRASYSDKIYSEKYLNEGKEKEILLEGFEEDYIEDAVRKYFKHYNIEIESITEAVSIFTEPLYLKIFCEANRGRVVPIIKQNVFEIFEEYLEKVNLRILEKNGLEPRFNKNYVAQRLNKLGEILWELNSRNLEIDQIVPLIFTEDDLLEFESEDLLIFRDFLDAEVVTFTYDLLGGYIIAKNLVSKINNIEDLEIFLYSTGFKEKLINELTLHSLFNDTLNSLSIILFKKFGIKIVYLISGTVLAPYVVEAIFEVDSDLLSNNFEEVTNFLTTTFLQDQDKSKYFRLLSNVQFVLDHPLNIRYFSTLLSLLSLADRDLIWSEYVRFTYQSTDDVIFNEMRLLEEFINLKNEPSGKVHLIAQKVIWYLTSTIHDIRDYATKVLFIYGLSYPLKLLELAKYALALNDPYISERVLAALYGLVISKVKSHNAIEFNSIYLPTISKGIYELMFQKCAKYSTTHIITREYASRIIETANLFCINVFTKTEIKYSTPPYTHGGIRKWGEYDYSEIGYGNDNPMKMDFSNYQIGYIVPNGHSYSDPPEKQKVRRQIYWRIFNLGWTKEKFAEVDERINNNSKSFNRTQRSHVERYGKKYSLIAYYEISGLREDQGKIKRDYYEHRSTPVDIDPTFILPPNKIKIISEKFISSEKIENKEWIIRPNNYDFGTCLQFKDKSDWICLNGLLAQKNEELMRKMWFYIDAIILNKDDYERLSKFIFDKKSKPHESINAIENHYVFGMEMLVNFNLTPENNNVLNFQTGTVKELIPKDDRRNIMFAESKITFKGDKIIIKTGKTKDRVFEKPVLESFNYLNPIAKYSWESYHSSFNLDSAQNCLSKELFKNLNLFTKPQTLDLFDKNGNKVFVNLKDYHDYDDNQYFSFIKKDILDKYLSETNSQLLWYINGENEILFNETDGNRDFFEKNNIYPYREFDKFILYEPEKKI